MRYLLRTYLLTGVGARDAYNGLKKYLHKYMNRLSIVEDNETNRSPGGCPTVSGSSRDNSGGPWKNQHLELDWNCGGLVLG